MRVDLGAVLKHLQRHQDAEGQFRSALVLLDRSRATIRAKQSTKAAEKAPAEMPPAESLAVFRVRINALNNLGVVLQVCCFSRNMHCLLYKMTMQSAVGGWCACACVYVCGV